MSPLGAGAAGPSTGLSASEARSRLAHHGRNELPVAKSIPWWRRVVGQLRSSIIYILLFALAFDVVVWLWEGADDWPLESIAIATILALNTTMGVLQEYRAEAAIKRLRALTAPRTWVLRDGHLKRIDAALLVPGDTIRVEAGDRIPADGTLTGDQALLIDESLLTGESVPVSRAAGEEALSGTLAVRGLGWLEVSRTGPKSAMGQIAGMLETIEAERTPLEKRLEGFGHRVARWVGLLAAVLAVLGVAIEGFGRLDEVLLFAVAVAVAAVPEGLPAVVTLTLALGTEHMSKRRAVIRRLSQWKHLGPLL